MFDVIVVGAGPSGTHVAEELSGKGLDVVVLEKKEEIGKHVICTGIVSTDMFSEFGLPEDSVLKEIKEIKWISPEAKSLTYEHPNPFAYVVDREKFDKNIGKRARSKGTEFKFENEVVDISPGKKGVKVSTKRNGKYTETYHAQMVLIATGINYNLHKKLGLGHPKNFLQGVQAELEFGSVECTQVFLGKEVAHGAFAWLVPIGGETVRIGLMTEKDPKGSFSRLINKYYPDRMINMEKNRIQFKAIAQGLVSKTYGDRVLSIGEAAGQVKTTTGGGIYFGLICSDIAAKVVVKRFEEGIFTSSSLAEYEKTWRKSIQKEIVIGYYARKICSRLKDSQIEKIFQIAQNNGVIPMIREKGNFDWHSDLVISLLKHLPFSKFLNKRKNL